MSQTIDEILESVRLEVRRRSLKLAPDLDETNGAVTPIAFQASERLASDIRQLVDTGRFSNVTEQVYQPTPSSTLSVRGFLPLHDQHFVNFVYVSILGQAPEPPGRDLRQLRQERTGARSWCVYAISLEDGRLLSKLRDYYCISVAERSFPLCDRVERYIKPML